MPLRPLSDVSAADWFVDSEADWSTKVGLGPPGFEAYARVYYDLGEEAPFDSDDRIRTDVRDVLKRHTTTSDDCYFALWNGWGVGLEGGPQDTGLRLAVEMPASSEDIAEAQRLTAEAKLINCAPAFDASFLHGPKVRVPNREFYLFGGPLTDTIDWGAADYAPGMPRDLPTDPALMWPADRAWFVAGDVDPDWIGVGGTRALIDELVADARLNVALATYDATDWEDR